MRLNVTHAAGHRPPRRGRGLSRRRQDRHGRDAGTRRLSGEGGDLLLRRRLSHGCAQVRGVRAAVRAADRRGPAATTSPPASTPPPPPPASSSASRPLLGVLPRRVAAGGPYAARRFDAPRGGAIRSQKLDCRRALIPPPNKNLAEAPCSSRHLLGPETTAPRRAAAGVEIAGITADSRQVRPGWLFAAIAGSKADGARFVPEADRQGCRRHPRQGRDAGRRAARRGRAHAPPSRAGRWP